MYDAGVFGGYPDGSFRPENRVTRAEYIAMVRRIAGATPGSTTTGFADVPGHWAESEISAAENSRWLLATEHPDQRLHPDEPIPRQEMARIVARAAGLEVEAQALTSAHTAFIDDTAIGVAFRPYVKALVDRGLIGGYPDGSFGPGRGLTRAEAVVMLVRLLNHLKGGSDG